MIDKPAVIGLLDRFPGKILSLQIKHRLDDGFHPWHYESIKALETVFGPCSAERKVIQQIS